jgi:hypothetical protein
MYNEKKRGAVVEMVTTTTPVGEKKRGKRLRSRSRAVT